MGSMSKCHPWQFLIGHLSPVGEKSLTIKLGYGMLGNWSNSLLELGTKAFLSHISVVAFRGWL